MQNVLIISCDNYTRGSINMIETFSTELGFQVAGSATDYDEAMRLIKTYNPDLIVCDVGLYEDFDGIDLIKRIGRKKSAKVLFLGDSADDPKILKKMSKLKNIILEGFLLKPVSLEQLKISLINSLQLANHPVF
ncbi:hypothetical protein BKI52_11770 [marine bacterium AO1-C]|nr:hypothetical protein BKI52_11770 [marine bacterium AO1-C]